MSDRLDTLYIFENDAFYIIETKRLDLPETADKADVYKWLSYNKKTQDIEHLGFRSMSQDNQMQTRHFDSSALQFNNISGQFTNAEGQTINLKNISHQNLPNDIADALERFILNQE